MSSESDGSMGIGRLVKPREKKKGNTLQRSTIQPTTERIQTSGESLPTNRRSTIKREHSEQRTSTHGPTNARRQDTQYFPKEHSRPLLETAGTDLIRSTFPPGTSRACDKAMHPRTAGLEHHMTHETMEETKCCNKYWACPCSMENNSRGWTLRPKARLGHWAWRSNPTQLRVDCAERYCSRPRLKSNDRDRCDRLQTLGHGKYKGQ